MVLFNGKLFQRVSLLSIAFILAISSVSAAAPFFFAQRAFAATTHSTSVANLAATVASADPGDTIDIITGGTISSQVIITKPMTVTSSNGSIVDVASGINAIGIQSNDVTIDHLAFEGTWNFGDGAVTRALEVSSYNNISIKNNTFKHLRQPAYINDNTTGTIQNNYTDITKGWVLVSNSDFSFSGNTWGDNVLDIALIAGASNNYPDSEVVSISDANNDAVVENQFGSTKRLSDSYVTVASNGRSGDEASKWNPTTTIQAGVDRVVTGGTVHVAAGSYASGANINKPAILKGAKAGSTAVGRNHGAATESLVIGTPTSYTPTFAVNANGVIVDGFDFGPSVDGASAGPVAVDLGSTTGAFIKNSIFSHNQRGISLSGASNVTVTGNFFKDNNSASTANANASIWGDSVNSISVSNNELDGASNTAINLAGSQNITINTNIFKDNGNSAVIWQDQNVNFSNNYGRGFNGSGLYLTGSSNVAVNNNDLSLGTGFNGISISTASGIPSSNVTINNNAISGFNNAINFSAVAALSDTLVSHGNKLSGNYNAGINGPASATVRVDAINNWWGAGSGPSDLVANDNSVLAANPGAGSSARGAVKYTAWCVTEACTLYSDATLGAPTGLTPVTGTVTNDKNFNNTWAAVSGAAGYEYQTSYSSNGTTLGSIIYNDSSATNPSRYDMSGSTVVRTNIDAPDANYYWQVRTVNAEGVAGPWSTINLVTVDTTAPKTFKLTAPADNAYQNVNDFYFTWDAPVGDNGTPLHYEFQSSQNSSQTDGALNTNVWKNTASSSVEQNYLATPQIHSTGANGTWYWQARAVDAAGNVGPWSTVWNLNIDTSASAAPTNAQWFNSTTANVLGAYTNQNPTTPAWTAPTTGTVNHYEYSFRSPTSDWSAWESVGNVTNLVPNSFYGAGSTGTQGEWQYRVRTINNFGVASPEAYSATIVYDRTNPNSTNDLSALVSGSVVVQQTITDNTAPASGKMRIWKQNTDGSLNNSQFFSIGDVNVNSSNQVVYSLNTLTNLFGDGVYTAKFTSTDKAGNLSVSQVVFRVDNTGPLLVANGYTGTSLAPTITGTTDGASDVVTIDGASAIVSKTVNSGGTYDWTYTLPTQTIGTHTITVKSTDSNGNSTTATKTVDIQSIPAAPVTLTAPATTSTTTTTPAGVAATNTQPATDNLGTPEVLGTQTKADATDTAATPEVKGASTQADQASGWALAWYWWVLIIAAVASFIWWLIARRRNLSEA